MDTSPVCPADVAAPTQRSDSNGTELPSRSRFFWEALVVFWCSLVLSRTLGTWLQTKSLLGGLVLTELLLVLATSFALWQITPASAVPLAGLRQRLNWVFFGGAVGRAQFAKKRAMTMAFWASAGCLMLALSAALPLELKMYPTFLLTMQGDVTPDQSESGSFPFVPTGETLVIHLRADTQRGTVTFAVHAPEGQLIGKQTGGRMRVDQWTLPAARPGTYTLVVTPHEAEGHWEVHIGQRLPQRHGTGGAPWRIIRDRSNY